MPKPITGTVSFPKELATDDLWHSEPFDRPRAMMDLWLLANDRRRILTIRGQAVTVERGQLAHSIVTLSERWRWSRPKTSAFLVAMQDERRIMVKTTNLTTIITVMDYTVYNPDTTPENAAEFTAEMTPEFTAEMTANFTQKRGSMEGGSTEAGKEPSYQGDGKSPIPYPEVAVPALAEFVAACEMRGIPAWYAETDHAWRSERPHDRWPRGANWQTAVTSVFTRWRATGSPLAPSTRNGAEKKPAGAWEIKQRILALQTQAQNHPANEASAAWTGDPTDAERMDLEDLQKKLAEAERELAGTGGN